MLRTIQDVALSPLSIGIGLVLAGLLAGRLLVAVVKPTLSWLAQRSQWTWDDMLVRALATPLAMLLGLQLLRAVVPSLDLKLRSITVVQSATSVLTTATVIWAAFRCVDLLIAVVSARPWVAERPSTRSLIAITGRLLKVLLVALSIMALLAYMGVSVTSLIAGLGIGGLALALSAQKTVENLFGTLSIGVDQPLREGDFVRVTEHLGTVEAIGLRSTRIRTLDRTLVTIPNGQLADQRIESYTARDRMRLACDLGLVYGTTVAQMRAVLRDLEAVLTAHPHIWPDSIVVRFKAFGASSLDIEIMAWFQTSVWAEFQAMRQDVLLQFMEVVERHGTAFAFPTRTVHLAHPPGAGGTADDERRLVGLTVRGAAAPREADADASTAKSSDGGSEPGAPQRG
jgi:MscS family membrane protein